MESKLWDATYYNRVREVKELLKTNPSLDINWKYPRPGKQRDWTALHVACQNCQEELIAAFLSHPQINVNPRSATGNTPFLRACRDGQVPLVKLLLKDGRVQINLANNKGSSPLYYAAKHGLVDVVKWMIASGRELHLDKKNVDGKSTLEKARINDQMSVVSLLERFSADQEGVRKEVRTMLGIQDFVVVPSPPKLMWAQYVEFLDNPDLLATPPRPFAHKGEELSGQKGFSSLTRVASDASSSSSTSITERSFTIEFENQKFKLPQVTVSSLDDLVKRVRDKLAISVDPKLEYFDPDDNDYVVLDDLQLLTPEVKKLRATVSRPSWWAVSTSEADGWQKKGSYNYSSLLVKDGSSVIHQDNFVKFQQLAKALSLDVNRVKKVFMVQNSVLINQMEGYRNQYETKHRLSPSEFKRDDWKTLDNLSSREYYLDHLRLVSSKCPWYTFSNIPVIPMCHGTVEPLAWKISQAGFGTVCKLDSGYYGTGMYFTSSLDYAESYAKMMKDKYHAEPQNAHVPKPSHNVVMLALVVPGNTFPVTENPDSSAGYLGKPCRTGYQSHYTIVGKDVPQTPYRKWFPVCGAIDLQYCVDELVVFQDAQVCPLFVVHL